MLLSFTLHNCYCCAAGPVTELWQLLQLTAQPSLLLQLEACWSSLQCTGVRASASTLMLMLTLSHCSVRLSPCSQVDGWMLACSTACTRTSQQQVQLRASSLATPAATADAC